VRQVDHPHVTLARALWTAVADSDAEAIRLLLAEDVLWRSVGQNPLAGDYRGPAGVLDYLASAGESVDRLQSSLLDVYLGNDGAILWYHVEAKRGRKTLSMDFALRIGVREARIAEALVVPVDQRKNDAFWK
jgi:ketosteroid isomerase-like protein